jgi:WD40 repeat protein
LWDTNEKQSIKTFNVGKDTSILRKCKVNDSLIASGGRENDLKVWNIESEKNENIFKAKNVI